MSGDWLEARLGKQYDDGEELELLGGNNYIGFVITKDLVNGRYDFELDPEYTFDAFKADHFDGPDTVADAGTFRAGNNVGGYVARRTDGGPVLVGGYIDGANSALYGRRTGPYVTAENVAVYVDSAGVFYWRGDDGVTETDWMALSSAGLSLGNRILDGITNIANITSIKGATVAAPVEGAQITTTATINVSQGNNRTVTAAGGAYAITLGTTGSPFTGEIISLVCSNSLANAVTVTNGGGGGGNIGPSAGTMPSGAKLVCDFVYDGTDWALAGVKRIV